MDSDKVHQPYLINRPIANDTVFVCVAFSWKFIFVNTDTIFSQLMLCQPQMQEAGFCFLFFI